MKQILKTLMLVMAMNLAFTQMFAYEDWTSSNHADGSSSSHTWNISGSKGQYLAFDWLVSSESGYDYLTIRINNGTMIRESGEKNNSYYYEFDQDRTISLVATYSKDGSGKRGNDNASVMNVHVINSGELSLINCSVGLNKRKKISFHIYPTSIDNSTLSWSSSNESIVSVDQSGVITGLTCGTTTITATNGSISGSCSVDVVGVESIVLNDTSFLYGTSVKIDKIVLPLEANEDCLWTSSDESIAIVDQYGNVTGVGIGTANITAMVTDGSGKSASCNVEVTGLTDLTFSTSSVNLFSYSKIELKSSNILLDNAFFDWESSNPEILKVNSDGKIFGISSGTAIITVSSKKQKNIKFEKKIIVNGSSIADNYGVPIPQGEGIHVNGVYSQDASWSSRLNGTYGIFSPDEYVEGKLFYVITLDYPQKLSFDLVATNNYTSYGEASCCLYVDNEYTDTPNGNYQNESFGCVQTQTVYYGDYYEIDEFNVGVGHGEVILPAGTHRLLVKAISQGQYAGIKAWTNAEKVEFLSGNFDISSLCSSFSLNLSSYLVDISSSNTNVIEPDSWSWNTSLYVKSEGKTSLVATRQDWTGECFRDTFDVNVVPWYEFNAVKEIDRLSIISLNSIIPLSTNPKIQCSIQSNVLENMSIESNNEEIVSFYTPEYQYLSTPHFRANSVGECRLNVCLSNERSASYLLKVINGLPFLNAPGPAQYEDHIESVWTSSSKPWKLKNGTLVGGVKQYYDEPGPFIEYLFNVDIPVSIECSGNYSCTIDDEKSYKSPIFLSTGLHRVRFTNSNSNVEASLVWGNVSFYDDTFSHAIINHEAKMDTIVLSREGILGGEALKLHDNLSDFTGLCVSGPFDEYDWKSLSEMTNLKCLDISGVVDESYPEKCNVYVNAVKMSEHIDEINGNPFESSNLNFLYIPANVTVLNGRIHGATNIFYLSGCEGVETIGASAFSSSSYYSPSGLFGDIIFPSLRVVNDHAFRYCSNIKSFTAPELTTLGQYAFADTKTMASFSAEKVDSIATGAFMASGIKTINMPKLRYIGSNAFSIQSSYSSYYSNYALTSICIPAVETIGSSAFFGQESLRNINIKSVESIGQNAFRNVAVDSIFVTNATFIGNGAFYNCYRLKFADVRRATSIGENAFALCTRMDSVNMSKVQQIGVGAFRKTGLKEIHLPNVTTLSRAAFKECNQAIVLELSDKLTAIGDSTFFGCTGLETITLPASLAHLPAKCFNGSNNIKKISINAPAPPSVGETPFTMQTVYTAQLYVPESSIALYQAHDYWKHFYYYNANPDVLKDLVLSTQLVLGDVRTDKVRLTIQPGASMSMSGSKSQDFRSVTFMANGSGSGMFLSECERINSDETSVVLDMNGLTWYYICMPFDVEMSDIQNATGALLAVHYYNGANRAAKGTGNNWTRMYSGTLNAGTGYIIQASKATTLTLPASFETKDVAFHPYNINHSLEANVSTSLSNQGWNFIGNPYMTYYDIAKMNFEAPITVREGNTYVAYSTIDDEYALRPLQPFFVQCPEGVNKITFDASGRQTTANIAHDAGAAPTRMIKNAATRNIIDITMSDGVQNDRTRVVVNKAASDAYELSCDAAKMMSEGAIQLYTIADEVRYAINEGPQTCGTIQMGYNAPSDGEYTIALSRGMMNVTLYDRVEEKSICLNEETYTFYTSAGENEDRFVLVLENANGIDDLQSVPSKTIYYDLTGRRLSHPAGISIKRQDGNVSKQIVR